MSDIIEEKEMEVEEFCDKDEYIGQTEITPELEKEKEAIELLKAMKGIKLKDGGTITGATITFTDRKTKKKTVVKI